MALLVLNVSIDVPDELLYSSTKKQGVEINEMESVAEFVFEACLQEEDCFPETEGDDEGSETGMKKGHNWKSVLIAINTKAVDGLRLSVHLTAFTNYYIGTDYSNIPYAPPCSA